MNNRQTGKQEPSILQKIKEIYTFFRPYLKGFEKEIVIVSLGLIVSGLTGMITGWVSGITMDLITEGDNMVVVLVVGFTLWHIGRYAVRLWLKYIRGALFNKICTKMGNRIYEKILKSDINLFHKFKTEDLMKRQNEITVLPNLIHTTFEFIQSFAQWVFSITWCCMAHWGFIVIMAVEIILNLVLSSKFGKRIEAELIKLKELSAERGQRARESMAKIIDTKLNGSMSKTLKKVAGLAWQVSNQQNKRWLLGNWFILALHIVTELKVTAVKLLGIYLILSGKETAGFFVTLLSYADYFSAFSETAANFLSETLPDAYTTTMRIKEVSEFKTDSFGKTKKLSVNTLKVSNMSFTYPNKDKETLKDINFELHKGEIVGISGASGCGKSTIANLLTGLLKTDKGEITFDDTNIKDLSADSLNKLVSMVKQQSTLYGGTVRQQFELIPGYSDEKMRKACEVVKIADLIEGLVDYATIKKTEKVEVEPTTFWQKTVKFFTGHCYEIVETEEKVEVARGYDCKVAEHAKNFSGGQIQRLALAIVVMQDAEVIILDEATSAQDPLKQKEIFDDLYPYLKDKIVIVIAHRLSTITVADRILVMADGGIEDSGTFKELYGRCKTFTEFVNAEIGGLSLSI